MKDIIPQGKPGMQWQPGMQRQPCTRRRHILPLRYIILAGLFLFAPLLWAQVEPAEESREPRFLQRLAWTRDNSTLRYQVIIEKEEEGTYRPVLQEFTAMSFVEVALPPGQYRCRVIPYDFLDHPGEGSEWISIEVRSGPVPRPATDDGDISVTYLEPDKIEDTKPDVPKKDRLIFLYLGAGWAPVFPMYGEENQFLGKGPSLAGAAVRFGAVASKPEILNIGLELTGSWYIFDPPGSKAAEHVVSADLALVAQKWLPNGKAALRYRLGAGLSLLPGGGEPVSGQNFHTVLGLSFLWLFREPFFLEAGIDYTHLFMEDLSGYVRPWIGVGVRL